MDKHDRAALTLALEQARAEDEGRAGQIDSMLRQDGWQEAAMFAASCCQSRSLHLDPWSLPPCHGDSDNHHDPAARKLLRQMLDLGVSRWHPSPLDAVAEAKKRKVA